MSYWNAFQAAQSAANALEKMGIDVSVTHDPDVILESVSGIGKEYLTPWLDPRMNDFFETNFFWIIASRLGKPVIVGGGRADENGSNAVRALDRLFTRHYGAGLATDFPPELNTALSGRAVYLGDLKAVAGSRKAVREFLCIANYISAYNLGADVIYSFMRDTDVLRGSADTNGFDRRHLRPFKWSDVPPHRSNEEVLVYRRRESNAQYFSRFIQG